MSEVKPIKVTGFVPIMDGTDNLRLVEIEITDPKIIAKIKDKMVNNFSLDTKTFNKEK